MNATHHHLQEDVTKAPFWRRLTLWQQLAAIMLPLTLLSMVVAVGGMTIHQQAMRTQLPEAAWKTATDPALELTLVAPLVLVPPLVFAVAALWFGARQIVRPLQQLEVKAAALAGGDFESIRESVGGITEVRRLQGELVEMARRVHAAQEGLHDYIGAITAAQEEERTRMARELHDDTIQSVIALKQRVQLTERATSDRSTRAALGDLETLAEQTIENLRRLTRALRPIYLEDLGLVPALQMLAREREQGDGPRVTFQQSGRVQRLPHEAELALYRIAQEALNNVYRHSHASHAEVDIDFGDQEVRLRVKDNGNGFTVPATPIEFAPSGHFGLLGMRERAELIGARLVVRSQPGTGAELSVQLPYSSNTG